MRRIEEADQRGLSFGLVLLRFDRLAWLPGLAMVPSQKMMCLPPPTTLSGTEFTRPSR